MMRHDSDYVRRQANAAFKEATARDGFATRRDYEVAGEAIRKKTARLRSLRLAKEAATAPTR